MLDEMLPQSKISELVELAFAKRGSRRGANRKTPVDFSHWRDHSIVIGFPSRPVLSAVANH